MKQIHESSLSRIITHIEKTKEFGVISPFRKSNTDKENTDNFKELVITVRDMGYGYIQLDGGYSGDEGFFSEKSLFIPNIKRDEIIKLGKRYDQHSIIHKNDDNFALIGTNIDAGIGKVLSKFDVSGRGISIDDVGDKFRDFFSTLTKGSHSGKKFLFKMQEKVETNMYHVMKNGPKWITLIDEALK